MSVRSIDVACLCASWCRLCGDYRAVIDQVAAEWTAGEPALRWHWIDIEDEDELVGDFEVETFPTLVIADPSRVRFAGPLTPHADTLRRVLRTALAQAPSAADSAPPPEVLAFVERLRLRAPRG